MEPVIKDILKAVGLFLAVMVYNAQEIIIPIVKLGITDREEQKNDAMIEVIPTKSH